MKKLSVITMMIALLAMSFSFTSCKKDKGEPELTAALSMEGNKRPAPTTIHFTNESENADSYLWDFGDGETSEEINPTHEYTEAGSYVVKLEASNEAGDSNSTNGYVTVYGTLTGWELDAVSVSEDAMTDVTADNFVYLILLDNSGNYINYTGTSGGVEGFYADGSKKEWRIYQYDGAPVIVGMNSSVTVKILSSASNSVDPNNDPVIVETTINTQNDLIPANDLDSYPFYHSSNNDNLQVELDWVDEE